MGKRDARILATVAAAFFAFDGSGLSELSDISHLSVEELERGEELLASASDAEISAALAATEADIEAVSQRVPS